jgi:hypothetical protein
MAGLPVSAGIEPRARVILDKADADLELGDILVSRSWFLIWWEDTRKKTVAGYV